MKYEHVFALALFSCCFFPYFPWLISGSSFEFVGRLIFGALKCDICNTLLTYCWGTADAWVEFPCPSFLPSIRLISPLRHCCCSCPTAKSCFVFVFYLTLYYFFFSGRRTRVGRWRLTNLRNKFQFGALMESPKRPINLDNWIGRN